METKVRHCSTGPKHTMHHVLAHRRNHCSSLPTSQERSDSNKSTLPSGEQQSAPRSHNPYIWQYLLSQRYSSRVSSDVADQTLPELRFWIASHEEYHYSSENQSHCENRPHQCQPKTSHSRPPFSSFISSFSLLIPTVQASCPVVSATSPLCVPTPLKTANLLTSQAGESNAPKPSAVIISSTNLPGGNVQFNSGNMTSTPHSATVGATVVTTTNGTASAQCLAPASSVFTSNAASGLPARVNLMSNPSLQNPLVLSRLNTATSSSATNSSPVTTIKLINNSAGTTQTEPSLSEKESNSSSTNYSSSSASASSSRSDLPSGRLPHRHSQIYDTFEQQPSSPPAPLNLERSFTFHPQVLPRQQQRDTSSLIIHHQFHHLTLAEKERFERLFREIDVNDNGFIDFYDLVQALERKGIRATHDNVKHVIERSDTNADGDIDFAEFVSYCLENEKKLHILFKDIDLNDDGKIDSDELVHAFERAGVEVDHLEVQKLVHRIKSSDNPNFRGKAVELDFEEFRDYLLLHPTDSLHNLMRSWRHGTFVDLGEDGLMPVDFSETEIQTGMWWRHLIAGAMAGAVSRTATAPLDRLKVFLQVRGAEFNGLGVCLRHMIHEGGVISLWRGNGINVLKIAPETAIKFMGFDQLKRLIHQNKSEGEITVMERFVAGSLAGAISQTVIYPMEVLKTRFCLRSTGQYSGLLDAARKINAHGGIRNFYRGYVPNLIGIIPYAGIDLTIYETFKKAYLKHNSLEEAPIYVCLACGTLSSTFGQIASYPLALIRTRMQSESGTHRSSMVGMFRTIMKKEGPRGLYRGITANIMKVAPAVSISYVVYEYTRRPLGAVMS